MCKGFKRIVLQNKVTDSVKMVRYRTFYLGFSRLIRNPVALKPELGVCAHAQECSSCKQG